MEANRITANMIAPCGLDCSLCKRALAAENPCPGCLGPDENKPEFCARKCGIILCRKRKENGYTYCDECPDYPCEDVLEKETRYTSQYPLYESPGKNLRDIREGGKSAEQGNPGKGNRLPRADDLRLRPRLHRASVQRVNCRPAAREGMPS